MTDEEEKAEEERVRRQRRCARMKRELSQWMNHANIPLIVGGFLGMLFCWPIGIVMFTTWFLTHTTIAVLDILPHIPFTRARLLMALAALFVPVALLAARLGDAVDLIGCLLITAWVGFIAVQMHKAILASRKENPD